MLRGLLQPVRNRTSVLTSFWEEAMLRLSPDRQPTNAVIVVMGDEPEVRLWCDEKARLIDLVKLGIRVKAGLDAKCGVETALLRS